MFGNCHLTIVLVACLLVTPSAGRVAVGQEASLPATHCGKAAVDYVLKVLAIDLTDSENYQRLADAPIANLQQLRLAFEDHGLDVASYRFAASKEGQAKMRRLLEQCDEGRSKAILLMPKDISLIEGEGHYFAITRCNAEALDMVDPSSGMSYSVKLSDLRDHQFEPVVQLVSVPTSSWSKSIGWGESTILLLSLSVLVAAMVKLLPSRKN